MDRKEPNQSAECSPKKGWMKWGLGLNILLENPLDTLQKIPSFNISGFRFACFRKGAPMPDYERFT
jgi:hypothetical protein